MRLAQPSPKRASHPRPPNAREREELALLREAFSHSRSVQEHFSEWWGSLYLPDRRLILALCGLDDSKEYAERSWRQHGPEHRDALIAECRRMSRLVRPISR
jgi:hypothetical protein